MRHFGIPSLSTATLGLSLTAVATLLPVQGWGQGCSPIRYMALSLSSEGIRSLDAHEWEATVSYRFLHSERIFIGDREQPQLQNPNGPRVDLHSVDVAVSYAVTRRWSMSLTLPYLNAHLSAVRDHADGHRHTTTASGIGDLRLVQNLWLLDPSTHSHGNVSLGLGVKAPSGDSSASDNYYTVGGVSSRPVDSSIQLGDGGWGAVLEVQAFQELFTNAFAYASGFYLLNPREQNDSLSRTPVGIHGVYNSVPDQFTVRSGLSYAIWPSQGLSLSLGGRLDGMPVHDLVGGSYGFRRPGYVVYIEPGVNFTHKNINAGVNCPVAAYRYRSQSVPEQEAHVTGAGGFADFLVMANVSIRF